MSDRGMPPDFARLLASTSGFDCMRIGSDDYRQISQILRNFDRRSTIALIAGLLTVPEYQVATIRIEILLHLAVMHCSGDRFATVADLRIWLETMLAALAVRRMEDPLEDVCVSNVVAPGGNYRIFEGVWETADHALQAVLDTFCQTQWGESHRDVLAAAVALLKLSEAVASRAGLPRWTISEKTIPADKFLSSPLDLITLDRRVTFTSADLMALNISRRRLSPFFLQPEAMERLPDQFLGHTSVERFPLIAFGEIVVLACPTAVSAAIRRYAVQVLTEINKISGFRRALRTTQAQTVFGSALPRLDAPAAFKATALPPTPPPSLPLPLPWDEVHCSIDVDKAAQVILMHDSLEHIEDTGLTSPAFLEVNQRLVEHIQAMIRHLAQSANAGLVVIVQGGIGRAFALALPEFPPRWYSVVMSFADFVAFSWSPHTSLLLLWKLNNQIETLSEAGIEVVQTNSLLNTYAFWKAHNFSFCPAEFPYPAPHGALLQIGTDFIFDFRIAERRLNDLHLVPVDSAGTGVRVRRLSRAAFFPTMFERPIYASEELAQRGQLAGIVEHSELKIWVWASKPEEAHEASDFLYKLWEGLLSWLDRLIPEFIPPYSPRGQENPQDRLQVLDFSVG